MKELSNCQPFGSARICVRAQAAPGVLERLLQPFTVLSLVPERLVLRPAAGGVFVVLEASGLDPEKCLSLVWRLRQMPCVLGARMVPRSRESPSSEWSAAASSLAAISRSAA